MGANAVLKSRMVELGLTQEEFAGRMNSAPAEITGRPGDVSARTVRNLLNGTSRRPIGRTCVALERAFDCPVEDLVVCVVNPSGVDFGAGCWRVRGQVSRPVR
jgi:transcriptional regulator with XRE-family HTH domain